MDDEKYFTRGNSQIKGNASFHTDNVKVCPGNTKYKQETKFCNKILVQCAISTGEIFTMWDQFEAKLYFELLNKI